jgi:hypothetical protein
MKTIRRVFAAAASLLAGAQIYAQSADGARYRISDPHSFENLSIFLIHGSGHGGHKLITLQEALAQNKVVVYETQNVNELAIANVSPDEDVFIGSGDIVKGGQQDRTLKDDFILPAKSGKVSISAFCVEHGRWTRRGQEPAGVFNGSNDMVATKELKMAVRAEASQASVWSQVAQAQEKLSAAVQGPARAAASPSSLQMTLETPAVQRSTESYLNALSRVIDGQPDVVGYAFAINGRMNSAEIYATHDLFTRLWPKLLKASAVEAVSENHPGAHFTAVSKEDVQRLLRDSPGPGVARELNARTKVESKDTPTSVIFQTRDQAAGAWVHMSYIAK